MENKKYRVSGKLLLGDRFILEFEMNELSEDDIPLWAKCLGWNFDKPVEEMICITDFANNDWIIETNKIIGWQVEINEI